VRDVAASVRVVAPSVRLDEPEFRT
jgi:hypothetical protein